MFCNYKIGVLLDGPRSGALTGQPISTVPLARFGRLYLKAVPGPGFEIDKQARRDHFSSTAFVSFD
jgi:hypothetical protein